MSLDEIAALAAEVEHHEQAAQDARQRLYAAIRDSYPDAGSMARIGKAAGMSRQAVSQIVGKG